MYTLSDAQLTSPGEAVCVGEQVVFVCQQIGSTLRWTVDLPGGVSNQLSTSAVSSQSGTVWTIPNDPGFGFEIHILSSSSASSVITELRVTAVRELNGVTVECLGGTGLFTSIVLVLGESVSLFTLDHDYSIIMSYLLRSPSCSKWSDGNC